MGTRPAGTRGHCETAEVAMPQASAMSATSRGLDTPSRLASRRIGDVGSVACPPTPENPQGNYRFTMPSSYPHPVGCPGDKPKYR